MNAAARSTALGEARMQARERWRAFAPRERMLLSIAGLVLVLFAAWSVFVGPALRVAREAPVELDRLDQQIQQMQRLAAEAKTLSGAPPVTPAQAVEPLKAATARLGSKATLAVQGERATLTLNGVSGQALRDWLAEARSAARARPVDVQLTRGPTGYTGLVVVTLGAGAS